MKPASPLPLLLATLAVTAPALSPARAQEDGTPPALVNPAAEFCARSGGTYEIRQMEAGSIGMCRLPDGRLVDAWDHFRENWDKLPDG